MNVFFFFNGLYKSIFEYLAKKKKETIDHVYMNYLIKAVFVFYLTNNNNNNNKNIDFKLLDKTAYTKLVELMI
jgi:hypothetical protein